MTCNAVASELLANPTGSSAEYSALNLRRSEEERASYIARSHCKDAIPGEEE